MTLRLLGQRSPRAFLQRHWQKRPLFVRGALPGFRGAANLREIRALAARDDVESRIVRRSGGKFSTTHGPFPRLAVPARDFTVLVSGLNLHLDAADELLRRFDFIPQARLDDIMVSYAVPGGGVGPHVDSYDVFLVQGEGRRRWTIWNAKDKTESYVCEPGDLLYLPPGVKHDGVALEPCYTYSVGFRAPRGDELGARFLDWLHERGLPDARYRDPSLRPAARPAAIPPAMVDFAARAVAGIRWTRRDVAEFLGRYLSEPKAHVVFRAGAGRARLEASEVRLDPKTQLLHAGARFFINGESFAAPRKGTAALRELADRRRLDGARARAAGLGQLLYDWRSSGYVAFRAKASG